MALIELTEWETGELVIVDPADIASARRIPSSVSDHGGEVREYGARTRIDTRRDTFLVTETPAEIHALANASLAK